MRHVSKILLMSAVLAAGACATQSDGTPLKLPTSAGSLEHEAIQLSAARTRVTQSRERSLIAEQATVAQTGQENAVLIAKWSVADNADRTRRLALFSKVTAASDAMYAVQRNVLLGADSALASPTAPAFNRAALYRLVLQLVQVATPKLDGHRFYVEYGRQIEKKIDAALADVLAAAKTPDEANPADATATPEVPAAKPEITPPTVEPPTDLAPKPPEVPAKPNKAVRD